MGRLVLIDSNAILHRAYHALPPLKTKKGELVNAVYGFISILIKVVKDIKPDYLAAAFDLAGPTFRDKEYTEYKAKRVKPKQEFYDQVPLVKKIISAMGIPIYEKKGFEADDVVGTIINEVSKESNLKTIIITGDLDTLQLVDKNVEVYAPKKGISEMAIYDIKAIKERYGLLPKQIVDLKALWGDISDNIPGVAGVGEKTAKELVKKFGSLENIYKNLNKSDLNLKLKARLLEYQEDARLSYFLATIRKDAPIKFNLSDCRLDGISKKKAVKLLEQLEFKSLVKRIEEL